MTTKSQYMIDSIRFFDGLLQNCSISSVLAMEILQSCTKASKKLDMSLLTSGVLHNEMWVTMCVPIIRQYFIGLYVMHGFVDEHI